MQKPILQQEHRMQTLDSTAESILSWGWQLQKKKIFLFHFPSQS